MTKRYDRAYFDRWYRSHVPIGTDSAVRRKVALAVSVAEYFLRRQLRNVIDIGCGEAPWYLHLQALRPRVRYAGFDPSEYAVQQFGASHNVRQGSFGELASLRIRERFDLLVCADVLHYLSEEEIHRGLPAMIKLMRGVAFLEVLTREDPIMGDKVGLTVRPAGWYQELFSNAGLTSVAPYMWLAPALAGEAARLEIAYS